MVLNDEAVGPFGDMGLELLHKAAIKEFGEERMNDRSSISDIGEIERARFLDKWCEDSNGLAMEGKDGISLMPDPRYGERELKGGISGDVASSRSVLLPPDKYPPESGGR